jgi:hypothetical protein
MKKVLIVLALIVNLYPSYAAFGVKKANVSAEQTFTTTENKVVSNALEPAVNNMVAQKHK